MNANQVIEVMGGRKAVMKITGLSKGRISQWITQNHIPNSWLAAFRALKPAAFADQADAASDRSEDVAAVAGEGA
jgi:hypothetical protein